jgi:hypothetical protein
VTGTFTGTATLRIEPVMTAEARVMRPTLMQQYNALSHGQQIGVLVVILLVLLAFDLREDVQEQICGIITVLGGAIWVIQRITKS